MPACSFRFSLPWLVCLCAFTLGCATTHQTTKTDGSFTTGGSGQYGQPAPGAAPSALAGRSKQKSDDYVPTPRLQLALAQFQVQRGYHDEARKTYEQVLAADAKSIEAIIGLARLDQIAGRTIEAEKGFQTAVRMDPRSGKALDALGQFYADQKRWTEAVTTLERAIASTPDENSFRFHYAIALAKSGRIEEAQPLLVEAVGSPAAQYNIGLILHDRGDLAASEDRFIAAILEDPRLQQAQYWLNEVRRERDQHQTAGASSASRASIASGDRGTGSGEPLVAQRQSRTRLAAGETNGSSPGRSQTADSANLAPLPPMAGDAAPPRTPATAPTPQQWEQWKNQR